MSQAVAAPGDDQAVAMGIGMRLDDRAHLATLWPPWVAPDTTEQEAILGALRDVRRLELVRAMERARADSTSYLRQALVNG